MKQKAKLSLSSAVTIILVILKLLGYISWSWIWITCLIWIPYVIGIMWGIVCIVQKEIKLHIIKQKGKKQKWQQHLE